MFDKSGYFSPLQKASELLEGWGDGLLTFSQKTTVLHLC